MHLAQPGAGVDAQFPGQQHPPGAVGFQRVGLAAGPVQRDHQLPAQPLPQGMLIHQPFQLRAQGGMLAERELRLDPVLGCGQPVGVQPLDLNPGERLEF